jgi:hypothetical protein
LATSLGFSPGSAQHTECKEVVTKLYKVFTEKECTLLEVNPLVETKEGKVRDCVVLLSVLLVFSGLFCPFLSQPISLFSESSEHPSLFAAPPSPSFLPSHFTPLSSHLSVSHPHFLLHQVMVCDAKLGFDDNAEFRQSKYSHCSLTRTHSDRRICDIHYAIATAYCIIASINHLPSFRSADSILLTIKIPSLPHPTPTMRTERLNKPHRMHIQEAYLCTETAHRRTQERWRPPSMI